jgi:hypothetical protein
MKRILPPLIALLLALSLLTSAEPQKTRLEVYLIDPCGKCMGGVGRGCGECAVEREMAVRYDQLLKGVDYDLILYNLREDSSLLDERDGRLKALGIQEDVPWPTMFIGEAVFLADGSQDGQIVSYLKSGLTGYPGYDAVQRTAEEQVKREAGNIVYLYSSYCESCKEVSKWLRFSIPKGYTVEKYDLATEEGVRQQLALCRKFGIAEEDLFVPFIAYGDYRFMGKDSIYVSLLSRIQEHPNLKTETGQ